MLLAANEQPVGRGDVLLQVAQISLGLNPGPLVVQEVDDVHSGVILGRTIDGPPMTDYYGVVRVYPPGRFMKV